MPNDVLMTNEEPGHPDAQLVRAIGVPGLAANIINTTIGASIFTLPATMSKQLGTAAPLAFLACAVAMVFFVTSFALAGSRVLPHLKVESLRVVFVIILVLIAAEMGWRALSGI